MDVATLIPADALVHLGTSSSKPNDELNYHQHEECDEVCLVDVTATTILYHDCKERLLQPHALIVFDKREKHGFRNSGDQAPTFWVVGLNARDLFASLFGPTFLDEGAERILQLTPEQTSGFKSLFLQVLRERMRTDSLAGDACRLWLQILVMEMARMWGRGGDEVVAAPPLAGQDPDVLRLWEAMHTHLDMNLTDIAAEEGLHYDSLRHRFARVFGAGPKKMFGRLRIEHAKYLLSTSEMSIKEISGCVGYQRQHEFARAFAGAVGTPPTGWRKGERP